MGTTRRTFLTRTFSGLAAAGVGAQAAAAAPGKAATGSEGKLERRALGKIKTEVPILGLGLGSSFFKPYGKDPEGAAKLLHYALKQGITYWDTARGYQNSEELIGPALKPVRDKVFMVSKSGNRTYDGFRRDLEKSLRLLQTDYLDLYHIHNLIPKKDKDLDAIEKGAVAAARKAKEEGLIRNFGVTGHSGAEFLMECIRRWDPDAVLTIFPSTRPDSGKYEDELLPLARERKMAVIAMKTVRHARNSDLKGSDLIRYAMSLKGVHCAIVGLDTQAHLDENVAMIADFKPMSGKQRAALHRDVMLAIGDLPVPWDMPGYTDGVPV